MIRFIVLPILCAACGRFAFDPVPGDAGGTDDAGDAGAAVQNVFTYETTVDVSPKSIAIDAVDPNVTMLLCDYRTGSAGTSRQPACELADGGTTVKIHTGVADPSLVVRVQTVVLPPGSSVRRGLASVGSGETVSSIVTGTNNLQTMFPLVYSWQNLDSTTLDERFRIQSQVGANDILITRFGSGNTINVVWQVVEIAGASVTVDSQSFSAGAFGVSKPVSVDPARSFVVGSFRANSGEEADNLFSFSLRDTAGTRLSVDRTGSVADANTQAYVVTVPNIVVEHGQATFTLELENQQPLGRAFDSDRTMLLTSERGGRPGQSSDLDDVMSTAALVGGDVLVQRAPSPVVDVGTVVEYQVIEWQ